MSRISVAIGWLVCLVITIGCTTTRNRDLDRVHILASPTIYRMAEAAVGRLATNSALSAAMINVTTLDDGIRAFCEGTGDGYPDVLITSQLIEQSDREVCQSNGIQSILELKIGYEGIVFASAVDAPGVSLSQTDIFLALARDVPGERKGELTRNPNLRWSDVNPELPPMSIEIIGPKQDSESWNIFIATAMESGCSSISWIAMLKRSDPRLFDTICKSVRDDRVVVDTGENRMSAMEKLESNSMAFGILEYNFLEQYSDRLKGSRVDGVFPTSQSISNGDYPLSRAIYFYAKSHDPDLESSRDEYIRELTNEWTSGEQGYLEEYGLIPIVQDE